MVDQPGRVLSDEEILQLRALVDFAAENGATLIGERIERIERDLAERPPEVPGLTSQLRSRIEAAKLAIVENNGFAAAWLIEQAEQIVGAINAVLAAPMVKAAAGSARGREKARPAIKARQEEKHSERDMELSQLLEADRADKHFRKRRSDTATAKRLAPLFEEWAKFIGKKPLSVRTIRKWLADQN
jgi:hypothetical protein